MMMCPNVLPTPLPVAPACDERLLDNNLTKYADHLPNVILFKCNKRLLVNIPAFMLPPT